MCYVLLPLICNKNDLFLPLICNKNKRIQQISILAIC